MLIFVRFHSVEQTPDSTALRMKLCFDLTICDVSLLNSTNVYTCTRYMYYLVANTCTYIYMNIVYQFDTRFPSYKMTTSIVTYYHYTLALHVQIKISYIYKRTKLLITPNLFQYYAWIVKICLPNGMIKCQNK